MSELLVKDLNKKIVLKKSSLDDIFSFIIEMELGEITFSTSLGQEDQVITHFINSHNLPIEIFTLDTGRLFQESYNLLEKNRKLFKKKIKVFFPINKKIEQLVSEKGPNSFYNSVSERKECCFIRKVEPLKRALNDKTVWITGLRKDQSLNRKNLDFFMYDSTFNIIKFNPLLLWSIKDVEKYLNVNNVPENKIHKAGYASIGCEPCTRPVLAGEDIRSGRWWWETSKKECGLHINKQ